MSKEIQHEFGYMCKIDFDFEVGFALGGNTIYPNIEDLKKHHPCWKTCGIVKVKVVLEEVINESDFWGKNDEEE